MELNALRTFYAVARQGSFTRAAAALRRQQPAVSRLVRQLEEELGVELFARTTRKVRLTAAGVQLLREAEAVLTRVDAIPAELGRGEVSGYLQFGTSDSLAQSVLPTALAAFGRRYPRVIPSIAVGLSRGIFAQVEAGELEFALFFGRPERGLALECRLVADVPFYAAIARERRKDRATLGAFIAARAHEDGRVEDRGELELLRRVSPGCEIRYSCNSYAVHRELVRAGLGFSVFPEFMIREDLKSGRLVALNAGRPHRNKLYLTSRGHGRSAAAEALIAEIARQLG